MQPALARIVGEKQPAVVAQEQALRVGRINDQLMVIQMQRTPRRLLHPQNPIPEALECRAAVPGLEGVIAQDIEMVCVARVHADIRELPAKRPENVVEIVGVYLAPALACIVGAVDLAAHKRPVFLRARSAVVEIEIESLRAFWRNGDTGPPQKPRREPFGQPAPGLARILRFKEPPAPPFLDLPGPGIERPRVFGVEREIHHTRDLVNKKHSLPVHSAVERPVDPTLRAWRPLLAHRRDIGDTRVGWVEQDLSNMMGRLQSQVLPRRAAVNGLKHPRARVGISRVPWLRLARAHPDRVRMALRDGHIPDGKGALVLKNRPPDQAIIHRLPEITRAHPGVDRPGVARRNRNRLDPRPNLHRANGPPSKPTKERTLRQYLVRRPGGCCLLNHHAFSTVAAF